MQFYNSAALKPLILLTSHINSENIRVLLDDCVCFENIENNPALIQ